MLRFNKLHLNGFKSFVDSTDVFIDDGLTGVVGPNGCGKSNLVEALRWVMGETSAKQMRGGEMDDVIFAGSGSRPGRNVAEVVLCLDNSERSAPAQFNDADELEISRRIERESGSTYRVNGKEVRARDVQLLFADSATGARSTALVSQGKIGAIIAAKPTERRTLLEEAAGIRGLHSRRHEAELRLRGADTNLTRLDDILVTLEAQRASLKKQARQASRYRNLSDHIRKAEATLFLLRWREAEANLDAARAELAEFTGQVAELTTNAAAAQTAVTEEARGLPALRQTEADAGARMQRLILARESLEAEEQRLEEARTECLRRLEQVAADRDREHTLAADADAAMEQLGNEQAEIQAAQEAEQSDRETAQKALAQARQTVEELDARLSAMTESVAANEARQESLTRALNELADRKERLAARAGEIARQRAELEARGVDAQPLAEAEEALAQALAALDAAKARAKAAEGERSRATDLINRAATIHQEAEAAVTRLAAEERALAEILETGGGGEWPAIIDEVTVEPGLESALGVALGEDLSAAADPAAPIHWRTRESNDSPPSLPEGADPLSGFVHGPAALSRRLAQVGLVAGDEEGERLSHRLAQGQRLVNREGALWRWDGFTISSGAATSAAARLEQRNRLREVRQTIAGVRARAGETGARFEQAKQEAEQAATNDRAAREHLQSADRVYTGALGARAKIKEETAGDASRLAALTEAGDGVAADLAAAETAMAEARECLARMNDPREGRREVENLKPLLAGRRTVLVECQAAFETLNRAAGQRRRRLETLDGELSSWRTRKQGALSRLEELERREQTQIDERNRLDALPDDIEQRRGQLLSQIESADGERKSAADALAAAEAQIQEAEKALRQAELELAQAREKRVRAEGAVEQGEQSCRTLSERIAERLECGQSQLMELSGLNPEAEMPEMEAVERKVARLHRERETMGPVNLRAEQEAKDLAEQLETLGTERQDLITAIEKLRRGISELNREGRLRLLASFKQVDAHFQELFVRLFGGGRAHLSLTESDDPLEAGLEIMASPPGKRLQVLSLLSGGEQALTALALLFAVFQTNPAPICVLDEVDAPLDDANVDRFCTLVDEMAHSGRTRFMIITHHRMTMARMDRLFGVTMSERGVSQLVSVDLQRAEELRATA